MDAGGRVVERPEAVRGDGVVDPTGTGQPNHLFLGSCLVPRSGGGLWLVVERGFYYFRSRLLPDPDQSSSGWQTGLGNVALHALDGF